MNNAVVAIAATTTVVSLVNRKLNSRRIARLESTYLDRVETAARVAFSNGYSEGHREGANVERIHRITPTTNQE